MPLVKPSIARSNWALAGLLLVAVFVASPGFFAIDEAIYYLGARAIAEQATLGLDNTGYPQFQSESLKLRMLIDGPQGLTPQYPAGTAFLAAPLLPLLGPRAFMLLNALGAIGVLFITRLICLTQFRSEKVAQVAIALLIFGTFWLEYAVGIWPHMLSSYFALQAYWFALRHLDSGAKTYRDAVLSGLFAGAGVLFRLDAFLAVPAVGLIMVMFAPRLLRSSVAFGLAVLPSLCLATILSYLKFGTSNPFSYGRSYGQSGGNVDLAAHLPLLIAICASFAVLLLFRVIKWRPHRRCTISAIALFIGALLLIPPANDLIMRLAKGFWALVIDIRTIKDPRVGIKDGPGGTLLFWTLMKKSLGQSMPWIGLAAMLLTSRVQRTERRAVATLLVFMATMMIPFILLSWHGGGGSNMRYFLPVLPAICILCAKIIRDLWASVPNGLTLMTIGLWGTLLLGAAWVIFHPSRFAGLQQIVSLWVLVATFVSALAAGYCWRFQQVARALTVVLFGGGLTLAVTSAFWDFKVTAGRRAMSYDISMAVAELPSRSLVITFPEWSVLWLPANNSIVASREPEYQLPDRELITDALDAKYRVFLTSFEFNAVRDVPIGIEAVGTNYTFRNGRMIELRRMSQPKSEAEVGSAT